jgi:hypothetical protein
MSQSQPPAYPSQPPQGGAYAAPQPPKKSHTVRNVFLGILLLMILALGGCLALLAGGVNEVDKAINEEQANDIPTAVEEGQSFTHDDFMADSGWKVSKEQFGGVSIENLSVTNNSDEARTALFTFAFYKGNENLAEVECSSNEMQGNEVSKMDCFSLDDQFPNGYDTIKVADAF